MANVDEAIEYVLHQEDQTLSGVVTCSPDGQRTRFGIDEHDHPDLTHSLFYTSMGSIAALEIARRIYRQEYAEPLSIAEIIDQNVADLLLSLGVNCGVRTAAKMLQDVLNVDGDGRIGPITLDAVDHADSEALIEKLRRAGAEHYEKLIAANPSLAIYRKGWMRRISS